MNAITQLFDSSVLRILTFGLKVWWPYTEQLTGEAIDILFTNSTGNKQQHENAHIKLCRQTLGVHNKAGSSRNGQVSYLIEDSRPSHCDLGALYNI